MKRTVTDAEFCEGFEVLFVSTSHCVFLSAFNAEATLSASSPSATMIGCFKGVNWQISM